MLETIGKVTLVFKINLGELFKTVKAKELCDFRKAFLSDCQQFVQDFLDFLDKIYFSVFAIVECLDLSV